MFGAHQKRQKFVRLKQDMRNHYFFSEFNTANIFFYITVKRPLVLHLFSYTVRYVVLSSPGHFISSCTVSQFLYFFLLFFATSFFFLIAIFNWRFFFQISLTLIKCSLVCGVAFFHHRKNDVMIY